MSTKKPIAEQRQFWQYHVGQWSQSGQRIKAYCQAAGLCVKQFTAWRQRLRREGWQPSTEKTPTLIPLEVRAGTKPLSGGSAAPITIRLGSGLGVEVNAGFDAPTLQAVVKALEAEDVRT